MSSLTQKEKLRALGISSATTQNNPYQDVFEQIEAAKTYSQFTTDVNGQSSYSEFESYLTGTIGVASDRATQFRKRMEQKYTSFSDFQNTISGFSSYDEWKASFSWGTTIGGDETDGTNITSGIRVHAEDGVSYDGVNVPKGTTEIFGPRVEFSETPPPIDATASFSTANLTIDDTQPTPGQQIQIQADVTNNSSYSLDHTAKLQEDGTVVETTTVEIAASGTETVTFLRSYDEIESIDVKVNEAGPTTVNVAPASLQL